MNKLLSNEELKERYTGKNERKDKDRVSKYHLERSKRLNFSYEPMCIIDKSGFVSEKNDILLEFETEENALSFYKHTYGKDLPNDIRINKSIISNKGGYFSADGVFVDNEGNIRYIKEEEDVAV